jgi:bifunctional DNase/RNase|uniref:Bifunctional nuclease family protein n=1 Tax=candidate division WOR-3 bacterium TaxID=2052148 RepID=A0A7C6A893_UNCW3
MGYGQETMIEVKVAGIVIDNNSNSPVMLLKEVANDKVLPIYIGPAEAAAIAYALENVKAVRPLTIDLMKLIVEGTGAKVKRVNVTSLRNDTFYAEIILETNGKLIAIDARPSDSVALALRTNSPIYVAEEIMNNCHTVMTLDEETKLKELRLKLRSTDIEDFGNYNI